MLDIETLMRRLAEAGVTTLLKADHERFAEMGDFWTFMISGGTLADGVGFIRAEERVLDDCIHTVLERLSLLGDEWKWISEFLPHGEEGATGS